MSASSQATTVPVVAATPSARAEGRPLQSLDETEGAVEEAREREDVGAAVVPPPAAKAPDGRHRGKNEAVGVGGEEGGEAGGADRPDQLRPRVAASPVDGVVVGGAEPLEGGVGDDEETARTEDATALREGGVVRRHGAVVEDVEAETGVEGVGPERERDRRARGEAAE